MLGPDQKFSLNPSELKKLVLGCKAVKQALGGTKSILKNERAIRKFAEASVVTIKPIEKGSKFTKENLRTKRPGTGKILANQYYKILGKSAKRPIKSNKQLSWKDVI